MPSVMNIDGSIRLTGLSCRLRSGLVVRRADAIRRPHGRLVFHLGDGRPPGGTVEAGRSHCWRTRPAPDDDVILTTKVMLARAHLDHNPSNNRAPQSQSLLSTLSHVT
jgi:hypothetical protein